MEETREAGRQIRILIGSNSSPATTGEIRQVLLEHPDSVWDLDDEGQSLLFHACMFGQSLVVVNLLKNSWPEISVEEQESLLVAACSRRSGFRIAVVRCLVERWPEATYSGVALRALAERRECISIEAVKYLTKDLPIDAWNRAGKILWERCLTDGASLALAQFVVQHWRELLHKQDNQGRHSLHIGLSQKSSDEVLEFLAGEISDALGVQDEDGNTPLHIALRHWRSTKLIEYLTALYPQACLVQDKKGRCPLHLVVKGVVAHAAANLPSEEDFVEYDVFLRSITTDAFLIVDMLAMICPSAVNVLDKNRNTPLHTFCAYFKHESQEDFYRHESPEDFYRHDTILPIIKTLVDVWPGSLKQTNASNLVPLQMTCKRESLKKSSSFSSVVPSDEIIDALCPNGVEAIEFMHQVGCDWIDAYMLLHPEQHDRITGNNALHIACNSSISNQSEPSDNEPSQFKTFLDYLSSLEKDGFASSKNHAGELPLHCACQAKHLYDSDIVQLAKVHPDAVSCTIEAPGSTIQEWPLHLLLRALPTKREAICHFALTCKEAVSQPDRNGILPFVRAALGSPTSALFCLIQINPELLVANINWDLLDSEDQPKPSQERDGQEHKDGSQASAMSWRPIGRGKVGGTSREHEEGADPATSWEGRHSPCASCSANDAESDESDWD